MTGTPDKRVVDCCLYLAYDVAQTATRNDIRGLNASTISVNVHLRTTIYRE
jgi:hypothetical protein